MTGLETFVFKKWDKLPAAFRVLSYFILLFTYIYILLMPKFIDGIITFQNEKGGWFPYRNANIEYYIDGRLIKATTNESGYWSLPLINYLPHSIEITVKKIEDNSPMPINLGVGSIWTNKLNNNYFKLQVLGDLLKIKEPEKRSKTSYILGKKLYAESLKLPEVIINTATTTPISFIENKIIDNVKELCTNADVVNKQYSITDVSNVSKLNQIVLVEKIQKDFNIDIPDDHWVKLNIVNDVIEYVNSRLVLQKYFQDNYQQQDLSFRNIYKQLPNELKPVFQ